VRHFLAFSAPTCACGTVQASIVHARPSAMLRDPIRSARGRSSTRTLALAVEIVEKVIESGCTMDTYAVRPGRASAQYRQDPLRRGDPLTPDGAKHP
jgi:hypothetical protein